MINYNKGIFYAAVLVTTLITAIIGVTFAFSILSITNNTNIQGKIKNISFDLTIENKTNSDNLNEGLMPLKNNLIENSINKKNICQDDNGNQICQVYKITLKNNTEDTILVDGFLTLKGPSNTKILDDKEYKSINNITAMRWAQIFCNEENNEIKTCTTEGYQTLSKGSDGTGKISNNNDFTVKINKLNQIENIEEFNKINIDTNYDSITTKYQKENNTYDIINKNYIRVSDGAENPDQNTEFEAAKDITSALVLNQAINSNEKSTYYIALWLTDTNKKEIITNESDYFSGIIKFNSSLGNTIVGSFNDN